MAASNRLVGSKQQRASQTSRMPRILGVALIALALVVLTGYLLSGNPIPLSKTGYELAKALYAACNLEDPARLTAVMSKLEDESLSPEERSAVASIVDLAQSGNWQDAEAKARHLLESQDSH